ncbi:MAG: 3-deoxy-manno-octulosonate cytidylyltransferase [Planctomycetota bacterium]
MDSQRQSGKPNVQIVLPARLASSRLKEKLLRKVSGRSVLSHTYHAASRATCTLAAPLVAVDDPRLADEVESFGGRWVMTPVNCASGTDRIAFVAKQHPEVDIWINVQGDEPEIDPASIDSVADCILSDERVDLSTAGTPIRTTTSLDDPSIVKIVSSPISAERSRAVYFSRSRVPHDREGDAQEWLQRSPSIYWHHLGLYGYRRDFLQWFSNSPPSALERIEKLEQLRAIEGNKRIVFAHVGEAYPGIDTEADLKAFQERFGETSGG